MKSIFVTNQGSKCNTMWKRKVVHLMLVVSMSLTPLAHVSAEHGSLNDPSNPQETEAFMDNFMEKPEVQSVLKGAVVTVVHNNQVVLNKGYGYSNVEKNTPVDANSTLFRVASISKTFTATAIMQLVEEGKVDLNRDISEYTDDLNITNNTKTPLTLKHLMTHTSGFDYTDPVTSVSEPNDSYSLEQFVKDNKPAIVRSPGEVFRYDNYAYTLQGYIVQKLSGIPFETYVQQHIFDPIGMSNSSFSLTSEMLAKLATPYDAEGKELPQYPNVPSSSPEGGLITTGRDMAHFMLAQLNQGSYQGSQILKPSSVQAMQSLDVSIHPDIPGTGYGFESSYSQHNHGHQVVSKAGDLTGFHSNMWLLPDQHTGLFIVFNSDGPDLREALFRAFMEHYYPNTKSDYVDYNVPEATLRSYEGLYRDIRLPAWLYEISATENKLQVTDAYGIHILTPVKDMLFRDENGTLAGFKKDISGHIAYFYYNKPDSWSEKLPEAQNYQDVPTDHPYAPYIYRLAQIGLYSQDHALFEPEKPVNRGEFVAQIVGITGITLSTQAPKLQDTATSPYAAYIQTALELGIVQGDPHGLFRPNQPITRQEAALMIWRTASLLLGAPSQQANLMGSHDAWAAEGIQFVVALGLYGPEVKVSSSGAVDYKAKQPMLKQESSVLMYKMLGTLLH
ncbi:CubicO group peptidase (beta-lactamase class C family) [Paenibacillus amylolyticus]|uniref:CubicO group peptidase (Beta-lactamase class C family) n=1 Tax=Paenibacillus amylolyticus TaxID=1451 RepID=A0AAP5H4B9_PAEAM|nr:serine hydrolase [Paenibacillus amylolyticus]MDR6723794.1 CubicO group peptidase (beta-lactamase class C family) [Paenibacillus amylolyticus]